MTDETSEAKPERKAKAKPERPILVFFQNGPEAASKILYGLCHSKEEAEAKRAEALAAATVDGAEAWLDEHAPKWAAAHTVVHADVDPAQIA